MTDTTTLAPTDAEICDLARETETAEPGRDGYILPVSFARAVLAKWGAPAPVAEDADDAARWRLLPLFMQGYDVDWVELLYNLEAMFKRGVRAQAAQPEGGANANR